MPWTKPDFEEISLNMEVTAYVNTDDVVPAPAESTTRSEAAPPSIPVKEQRE